MGEGADSGTSWGPIAIIQVIDDNDSNHRDDMKWLYLKYIFEDRAKKYLQVDWKCVVRERKESGWLSVWPEETERSCHELG